MKKLFNFLTGSFLLLICTSCSSLLPSSTVSVVSPWQDYESAKQAYLKIVPGATTLAELKELGFDPTNVPNIRIMSATDVVTVFVPNSSIAIEDLAVGIQKCIKSKSRCIAYKVEPSIVNVNRTGNFWSDLFTFKRISTTRGWEFRGLIAIVDDIVTYRDPPGGRPLLNSVETVRKPLGPLQEVGTFATDTIQAVVNPR